MGKRAGGVDAHRGPSLEEEVRGGQPTHGVLSSSVLQPHAPGCLLTPTRMLMVVVAASSHCPFLSNGCAPVSLPSLRAAAGRGGVAGPVVDAAAARARDEQRGGPGAGPGVLLPVLHGPGQDHGSQDGGRRRQGRAEGEEGGGMGVPLLPLLLTDRPWS